jgi:hypothetical protein
MIANAAYFRAERRGFKDGDPVVDWLEAEAEVDSQLGRDQDWFSAIDGRLATVSEKLGVLRKRLAGVRTEVREEWISDVEKLAKLRDKLQETVDGVRAQGEHASEKVKRQADKIWDELSRAVEHMSSRKARRSERAE